MSIALADGMTIASCLPLSISMVIALTASSNGDQAAAVFNAAFGNMVGIFLSPVLILMYLGSKGSVDLLDVFVKLTLRVLLPIVVGQILRKFVPAVRAYADKRKVYFKKYQEWGKFMSALAKRFQNSGLMSYFRLASSCLYCVLYIL